MAVINGLVTKYDIANRVREWVDNVITMLDPFETPVFSLFRRTPVANSTYGWVYEELRGFQSATTATVSSAASGATNTITITAGDATTKFHTCSAARPAIIRIDEEYMRVIAQIAGGAKLKVIRGHGGSTVASHASAAVVYILGELTREGADAQESLLVAPTRPTNVTQIFDETVEVSGTAEAIALRGGQYGIGSNIQHDIIRQMQTLGLKVERALVMGVPYTATDSATVPRMTKGLWSFVPSTNYASASGAALSESYLHSDLKTLWDAGARPSIFMANSQQILKLQELYENRIRTEVLENIGGLQVSQIANPFGGTLTLLPNRAVPQHEYYLIDPRFVEVAELRPFTTNVIGRTGDATKLQIVGEFGMKVTAPKAIFRRYNLSTS